MRLTLALLVLVISAPLAAFEFHRPNAPVRSLFDRSMLAALQDEPAPEPERDSKRLLEEWNSRGYGLSLGTTLALVYPGIGLAAEFALPVHQNVSVTLEAGLIGNIFYEGVHVLAGARGYLDLSRTFAFTLDGGLKVGQGRVLGYVGGKPRKPVYTRSIGGFLNPGLEVGSPYFRFFTEITLNGSDTRETHYKVEFFCGFNVGFRVYVGA